MPGKTDFWWMHQGGGLAEEKKSTSGRRNGMCSNPDAQAVQHGWEQGEARLGGGRHGTPKGHKWLTEPYTFQRGREVQEAGEQGRVTDGSAHQRDHWTLRP